MVLCQYLPILDSGSIFPQPLMPSFCKSLVLVNYFTSTSLLISNRVGCPLTNCITPVIKSVVLNPSIKALQGMTQSSRSLPSNVATPSQLPRHDCHYYSFHNVCVDLLPTQMLMHQNITFIFIIKALQCDGVNVNA